MQLPFVARSGLRSAAEQHFILGLCQDDRLARCMPLRKLKSSWQSLLLYIKYDLRDIINPRSLPNPPGWKEQAGPPFSFRRVWQVRGYQELLSFASRFTRFFHFTVCLLILSVLLQTLKAANKAYADSWRTPHEPESEQTATQPREPPVSPVAEDLGMCLL